MSELGQTNDPKALVPGDPTAIFENVRVLRGRYDDVIAAGEALKRIDTGGWTGQASDSFHEQHDIDVPRWFSAGESLDSGASALEDYAECLVWAQGQAAGAIDLWQQGEAATRQAKEAHDRAVVDAQAQTQANAAQGDPTVVQPPPFVDTGEPKRQAARDMLNPARQQLADAGDRTAEALHAEAQLAPQDSLKQSDADFFGGIWDTVSGFGQGLAGIITDPLGTAEAIAYNVTHPVETLKDAVAWDDWANGEGDRALGKIVGGMLLGGGVGKLAKSLLKRRDRDGDKTPDNQPPPPTRLQHTDGRPLSTPEARSVRSLERNIAEHERKLADYQRDPYAYDNKGILKNAPNDAVREQIIQGRIRHLQTEIDTARDNIRKILDG